MRWLALGLAVVATSASAADVVSTTEAPDRTPASVRNRFMTGVWFGAAAATGDVDLEVIVSDTLTAQLIDRDGLDMQLRFAGRAGVRVFDGRLDDPRIRALGLHLIAGHWTVDVGRFSPLGGGWRIADGVQVLADVGHGVQLGAWGGLGPDPYTTAPALRYGGGPILAWHGDKGEATLLGEVLATPDGLDRVSGVARGRVELGRVAELAGLIDLQAGGVDAPVRVSDATVLVRLDPHEDVRLDLVYDAWSSLSYLVSQDRDPALTRFAARSQALADDPWIPQDAMDPTVYHMAGTTLMWSPAVGADKTVHLRVKAWGRYRHHVELLRRNVNAGLNATLVGLAEGRVDVGIGGGVLWWPGQPGARASAQLWAQLDKQGRVALDMSGELLTQRLPGTTGWTPSIYADAFLDAYLSREVSLGVGYMFTHSADIDRWDTWHGAMLRLAWHIDTARRTVRRQEDS